MAGPGGEVVVVDVADQAGVVQHHPRGPEGGGVVAGAGDKFLAHAAVKKGDLGHSGFLAGAVALVLRLRGWPWGFHTPQTPVEYLEKEQAQF